VNVDHRHSGRGWRSGNGCEGCHRARLDELDAGRRERRARVVLRPVDRSREATAERRRTAVELRRRGLANLDVAQRLGVTERTVTRYVNHSGACR
jgi:DNA-binding NarL/FixJ family response regulator